MRFPDRYIALAPSGEPVVRTNSKAEARRAADRMQGRRDRARGEVGRATAYLSVRVGSQGCVEDHPPYRPRGVHQREEGRCLIRLAQSTRAGKTRTDR